MEPHLEHVNAFGENQFAYRSKRGCRDALAVLMITWISALSARDKIAVYCSDVAGTFDRVDRTLLREKLIVDSTFD